ncbi:receptor-like protein 40 [Culex quinquefasciatus]|uniref:receptor-like protein 40 n=1 Tax=Culex quinquefasciatus TaxID=7176 RepID=UPI0018E2E899|nr:receptor-like protein 40 [Culex quinquefasciatus]
MNYLTLLVVLTINQLSVAVLVKQYNCDKYILAWCQLHNVTVLQDQDLKSVQFPEVPQLGFINGTIVHFSHTLNLNLFKSGVLRIFARGTKISRLTLPNTIEQLYFRDNDLQAVDIEPKVSYAIKFLRIHLNKLRDITNFQHLKGLVELNLCDNLIEHLSFDTFASMVQLKQLLLCGNRLKTLTATHDIKLPNLYHLDLSGNFLFNQTSLNRWYFPRLGNFSLRDNLLTTLDVRIIAQRFPVLQILDVEHNSLNCETYQQLLKHVHQRRIIFNVDKRMCQELPAPVIPRSVPPSSGNELEENGGDWRTLVRQLKERLYQQVKIINGQRTEIEQLKANLTTLMEQFDLVVTEPAKANDPF